MKNESVVTTKCAEIMSINPKHKWTEQQVMSMVKKQNECIKHDKNQAHNLTISCLLYTSDAADE